MTLTPAEDVAPPSRLPSPPPPRRQRPLPAWLLALALVAACWLGGFAANNLTGTNTLAGSIADRLFPRVGQGGSLDARSLAAAWDTVRREYVVRDVNSSDATAGAEQGIIEMLRSSYGDRFSAYFTRAQYASLQDQLNGRHPGIIGVELEARCLGATLCPPGTPASLVAIAAVVHQSPAERAGLRRGDVVRSVDGRAVAGLGPAADTEKDKVGQLIRSHALAHPGSPVALGVERAGRPLQVNITPADLTLPSVYGQRFGPVLYLQVTGFNQDTAMAAQRQLGDAVASGVGGVVLDLRANPGGLVSEAQGLASQFLVPSATVRDVVVRRGRLDVHSDPGSAARTERDAVQPGGVATRLRLAVLVDQDSASAAEIVAAALKDYHRGPVVGVKSFGKGSVQEDFGLPDGSDLHLTVEKWFGPAGESIDGVGVSPDRTVALADQDHRFRLDADGADPAADAQLQAALAAAAG